MAAVKPVVINGGILCELQSSDTLSMIRTASAAIPAIAALGLGTVSVTWATPFVDTNYRVLAIVVGSSLSIIPSVDVNGKTMTGCTLKVLNVSSLLALVAGVATLDVVAIHD